MLSGASPTRAPQALKLELKKKHLCLTALPRHVARTDVWLVQFLQLTSARLCAGSLNLEG